MRKKALLRAVFPLLGITGLRWWQLPVGLYCFNYHRIGDPATTDFDRATFSCTAERFEEHVIALKEKFEVVGLDRLLFLTRQANPVRKPLALITFDDGYVDNYSLAFPILRKHRVTAVFFLPTAFIGTSRVPWWDEIAWLVRQAAGKSIELQGGDQPLLLRTENMEANIRKIMKWVKSRPVPIERQVEEIRDACGGLALPTKGRLFVDWDEVREMRSLGMDIGSHTHTHRLLAHLDRAEQREELARSKEILESALGTPVTAVAYPVGSRSAYDDETCALAAATGYRLGFNFLRRNNPFPLPRPLDVGRLAVDENIGLGGLKALACFPSLFTG
jgi:peptidoglycan/xylan/chitin deacetylase (PgdA/CDA1 family)